MPKLDQNLKKEYLNLWDTCTINPSRLNEIQNICNKILANKAKYQSVENITKVPWYFIATIHSMECSLSFYKHLHNGDPLTARTKQVPKGRPTKGNPPFTWEESAIDALEYDGFVDWTDWSISGALFKLESYNGWGYRNYGINTPYLWSYCSAYSKGKYVSDGEYDPNAISQQCGCVPILKTLKVFETKPVETKPIETKPIETQPIETQPIETQPIETQPIETQPIETQPIETKKENKPNLFKLIFTWLSKIFKS